MRILTSLTYYSPHWTGLTRYAALLAEGLAARGHEMLVLTSQHEASLPLEEVIQGVKIKRLPCVGRLSRGQLIPSFPAALARSLPACDLVQIHTPLLASAFIAGLCKFQRKPLVMTHHGDLRLPKGLINSVISSAVVSQMTIAGHMAGAVVAYSDDYARHSPFLSQFGNHLVTIPPPVPQLSPDPHRAREWKQQLGLADKKLIGFAGRFVEEKGFDILLQAIPKIIAREPRAHFVFAGDTTIAYESFFEKWRPLWIKHQNHITSLGLLQDAARLADFYAMCDVFALPSRSDCYALVQAEAMLCGTQVVASNIPGARVPVRNAGGFLVESENPQALAERLLHVLENPVSPNMEKVQQEFAIHRTLDAYEELYADLINNKKSIRYFSSVPQTPAPDVDDRIRPLLAREADMAYRRRALRLLEWIDPRPGQKILDCGCGAGFYLQALHAIAPKAVLFGFDEDVQRLAQAATLTPGAHYIRGEGERLPFNDDTFDTVLLSEVLEHLPDDETALRELFRILKPGGLLAVSVPHARYPWMWDPFNRVLVAMGRNPSRTGFPVGIWTNHVRLYEPGMLGNILTAAGFEVENLEAATHYSPPLAHFSLYGIGKPLIEHGLLPTSFIRQSDRFATKPEKPGLLFGSLLRFLQLMDAKNDAPTGKEKTFVNVLAKARKP